MMIMGLHFDMCIPVFLLFKWTVYLHATKTRLNMIRLKTEAECFWCQKSYLLPKDSAYSYIQLFVCRKWSKLVSLHNILPGNPSGNIKNGCKSLV